MSTVVREVLPLGFVQVTSQVPTGTSTRLTLSSRTVVGVAFRVGIGGGAEAGGRGMGPLVAERLDLEEAGGAHDLELLEDGEQGGRQLVGILGTQQQALAVVGDAPEDVPLLALEGEAHDMGRQRRGPGVRRGGRGARVTATGLEAIGHEHHRIDDAGVGRPEVARRALEGEGERRPAGGPRRIDLAVDGRLVHAIDGHQQVRGATADGLARGGVVAPVTVDPEADVDALRARGWPRPPA